MNDSTVFWTRFFTTMDLVSPRLRFSFDVEK